MRYVHGLLSQAFRDAERWGRVVRSPAALATPPSAAAASRDAEAARRTWSAEQVSAFLASVRDGRDYPLWLLLVATGARRGEALGLCWSDVDFERRRMAISRILTNGPGSELVVGPPKTRASVRSVALDERTLAVLREHRKRQVAEQLAAGAAWDDSGAGLVFRNEDGSPVSPNALSHHWRHVVAASGLPTIRLHDLRHTHATLALAAGVHPKVVQERLGHSTVSFTLDVYSHSVPALQEDAAERVAALFGE